MTDPKYPSRQRRDGQQPQQRREKVINEQRPIPVDLRRVEDDEEGQR
jgi:hypothetical protein